MPSGFESSLLPRKIFSVALAMSLAAASGAFAQTKKKSDKDAARGAAEHMKEELGVNQFTTPSIETVLLALKELRPVDYEKAARDLRDTVPGDRPRLALSAGALIADGFLAVSAEKQSKLDDIGRLLVRHAKGLGVSDHVTRHSKSILEKGAAKDWQGIRAELVSTQRDVEKAMMALKDEEIAHLVALGGWVRGLHISSTLVADQYTPERAAILVQPTVINYFIERVSTLNPSLKKANVFVLLEKNLAEIRNITVKEKAAMPTAADLKVVSELSGAIIAAFGEVAE